MRDRNKQIKLEWKGALKATQKLGKGLQKVFYTVVKENFQYLPTLVSSDFEVSYFIPEPRNVFEVTMLSDDINKPWLKETQKEIKNIINNHFFLVQDPEKGEPVTPCMDIYKAKTCSDGSLEKLKFRIVIRFVLKIRD